MIGDITTNKETLTPAIAEELKVRYIAIDVETTGLDCTSDYITEIGLVLFNNGVKVKEYSSLIKIPVLIPSQIVALTGITNEMVFNAPKEEQVYSEVAEFLKDALDEKTILVAHNANFDMGFIKRALERYGYIGVLRYVDTLTISRKYVRGLFNYKQDSVATYFNIVNEEAHRALTDADTCGRILSKLLEVYENHNQIIEINTPYDEQFEQRIRERGIIYYRNNLVNNYLEDNNSCSCLITGVNRYNVNLTIEDNYIKGTCECPFYMDGNINCKHIYALLLKYLSNK